ncbi:hypothetical protein, partial [Proteus myxofaciens]|uniref:hypothetical protein n=1 Tax=Proteus myxofaciens TaxID=184072 RepID=UPI0014289984
VENLEGNIITIFQDNFYINEKWGDDDIHTLFKVRQRSQPCTVWIDGAITPTDRVDSGAMHEIVNRAFIAYRAVGLPTVEQARFSVYVNGKETEHISHIYKLKDGDSHDFYSSNEMSLTIPAGNGVVNVGIKIPKRNGEHNGVVIRGRIFVLPHSNEISLH